MLDPIKDFFRKRKLRKFISTEPTSLLPLSEIKTANIVIDVEEPGFDLLKEDILAWGKSEGIEINIYFFDFRRLGKDELLLTEEEQDASFAIRRFLDNDANGMQNLLDMFKRTENNEEFVKKAPVWCKMMSK
jgi:hypothetical protein